MFSRKFIYTLSAVLSWAVSIVLSRFLFKIGESPYTLLLWGMIFSFPFWSGVFLKRRKEFAKLTRRDILTLIFIGAVGTIISDILELLSLKYTQATNFALLYRSVTIFTIIFAFFFFREAITRRKLVLLGLIFAGSFLFVTSGRGIVLVWGDVLALLVALVNALFFNILLKHAISKMHPEVAGAGSFFFQILPVIFLAALTHGLKLPVNTPLVFLNTVLVILLVQFRNRAYTVASASYVSLIFSLTPVFVSAFSIPLLRETLTLVQILGGLLIVSSGLLTEKLKI